MFQAMNQFSNLLSYSAPMIIGVFPDVVLNSGSQNVAVAGRNYGLASYSPLVIVGRTQVQSYMWFSDSTILSKVPAGQPFQTFVKASVSRQLSSMCQLCLSYLSNTSSSVTPKNLPTSGSTVLSLFGSSFLQNRSIDFQ